MKIFEIFDLSSSEKISREEMIMMLMNLPDIGFSSNQNINGPDKFYTGVRDSVINCIHSMN